MLIRNAMVEADESSRCLFPSFYFSSPIADRKHCINFIIIDYVSIYVSKTLKITYVFGPWGPLRHSGDEVVPQSAQT